jgi:hypothetical protein
MQAPLHQPPTVYVGRSIRSQAKLMSPASRLAAISIAGVCLALLMTAAGISPSPTGVGTHLQLHLQECAWLVRTGIPCPACGMTTSFAWFVRGNFLASFYIQPMGFALAVVCCLCVWIGGWAGITGQPIHSLLAIIPEKMYLIPLLTLAMAGWAWKIFIHLHHMDGWR